MSESAELTLRRAIAPLVWGLVGLWSLAMLEVLFLVAIVLGPAAPGGLWALIVALLAAPPIAAALATRGRWAGGEARARLSGGALALLSTGGEPRRSFPLAGASVRRVRRLGLLGARLGTDVLVETDAGSLRLSFAGGAPAHLARLARPWDGLTGYVVEGDHDVDAFAAELAAHGARDVGARGASMRGSASAQRGDPGYRAETLGPPDQRIVLWRQGGALVNAASALVLIGAVALVSTVDPVVAWLGAPAGLAPWLAIHVLLLAMVLIVVLSIRRRITSHLVVRGRALSLEGPRGAVEALGELVELQVRPLVRGRGGRIASGAAAGLVTSSRDAPLWLAGLELAVAPGEARPAGRAVHLEQLELRIDPADLAWLLRASRSWLGRGAREGSSPPVASRDAT